MNFRLHGFTGHSTPPAAEPPLFLGFSRPPPLLPPLHPTPLQSTPQVSFLRLLYLQSITMGAIPEVDPDEPVETKPFKFVTGELSFPTSNGSNSSRN